MGSAKSFIHVYPGAKKKMENAEHGGNYMHRTLKMCAGAGQFRKVDENNVQPSRQRNAPPPHHHQTLILDGAFVQETKKKGASERAMALLGAGNLSFVHMMLRLLKPKLALLLWRLLIRTDVCEIFLRAISWDILHSTSESWRLNT
jgi:hypothetical protein